MTPWPWVVAGASDATSVLSAVDWTQVAQANDALFECEANARLIAAAPELLEVLELWEGDGSLQTFQDRERFRAKARAAIRKATGETK